MIVCEDEALNAKASVVALGMFDGVHIGHQTLLHRARVLAREAGVPLVVQTFATHPLCVLDPDRCPPLLTTPEERVALFAAMGVDIYYPQPFTREVGDMPAEEFISALVGRWHPKVIVVGFNYTFGRGGAGTPETLKKLGKTYHFQTVVVPAVRLSGHQPVSATQIRAELAAGRALAARSLLGRAYARQGTLLGRVGEVCAVRWTQDGKQTPAPTWYYALWQDDSHTYPVLARVLANGTVRFRLPETAPIEAGGTLSLLKEREPRAAKPETRAGR